MATPAILSLGNMLVEVMRVERDVALDIPGAFIGPFPSGDTPIYISTAARLGAATGFIGALGADEFGRCLLQRLQRDGVDCSAVAVLHDATTGVAFVAYFSDGSRRFIFHMRDAASGRLAPHMVPPAMLAGARWLHITGVSLVMSESSRLACLRALELLPQGARVSFDPNIRADLSGVDATRALCAPFLERADLIVPSSGEAAMLTGAADDADGCRTWAAAGKLVVLKRGAAGCRLFVANEEIDIAGFAADEVDPTGAGDSFCAGLTVGLLEGMPPVAACRFANAVGALAVTVRGPMEGAPTRAAVEALLGR
ncbi:MAG TPA: sugar kinase [Roseiflexaceae bacterium]|nr:sugar kinase [Roseiflexaceae bacterium]HMP40393.1 sugar kinase [Roseiflexaceae bacterium]